MFKTGSVGYVREGCTLIIFPGHVSLDMIVMMSQVNFSGELNDLDSSVSVRLGHAHYAEIPAIGICGEG